MLQLTRPRGRPELSRVALCRHTVTIERDRPSASDADRDETALRGAPSRAGGAGLNGLRTVVAPQPRGSALPRLRALINQGTRTPAPPKILDGTRIDGRGCGCRARLRDSAWRFEEHRSPGVRFEQLRAIRGRGVGRRAEPLRAHHGRGSREASRPSGDFTLGHRHPQQKRPALHVDRSRLQQL